MDIGITDDSERESNPMAVTCGVPGFAPAPGTKPQVNAQCDVSEGGAHPKTNACSPVNSQLGAGHEPAGGPVDQVDHDRVRGAARADRRDSLYPHMHTLVELHGQPGWVAALTPLSVDGMIVAAS